MVVLYPFPPSLPTPFQVVYYLYKGLSRAMKHILALFWNFEWFSSFLWIDYFIEYSGLYWMNILDFILNWIIFVARFNEKMNFQNGSAGASPDWPSWPWWPSRPTYLCTTLNLLVRQPPTSLLKQSNVAIGALPKKIVWKFWNDFYFVLKTWEVLWGKSDNGRSLDYRSKQWIINHSLSQLLVPYVGIELLGQLKSGDLVGCYHWGTNEQMNKQWTRKHRATQPMDQGRLR